MRRSGGYPRKYIRHKRDIGDPVPVNALRHIRDQITVAQMSLPLRHTDKNKITFIGYINQLLIHIRQIYAYIIKHQSNLAALCQPNQIGALAIHIMDTVQKTGNDNLTAKILILREYLLHKNTGIRRLQY